MKLPAGLLRVVIVEEVVVQSLRDEKSFRPPACMDKVIRRLDAVEILQDSPSSCAVQLRSRATRCPPSPLLDEQCSNVVDLFFANITEAVIDYSDDKSHLYAQMF